MKQGQFVWLIVISSSLKLINERLSKSANSTVLGRGDYSSSQKKTADYCLLMAKHLVSRGTSKNFSKTTAYYILLKSLDDLSAVLLKTLSCVCYITYQRV